MNKAINFSTSTLGIELGSTRIKAILIDARHKVLASGSHNWENTLDNGVWTYSLDSVWNGIQDAYAKLAMDVQAQYDCTLDSVGAMGLSGMMHGYLPFDKANKQLTAFRTWRNTSTEQASALLTQDFGFNIPQRWSIAHLYQAMLNDESHVKDISYLTTLAGYVHWQLTGEKVLGVGEASGAFPIDSNACDYDSPMAELFDNHLKNHSLAYKMRDIFPKVLRAGESAGVLTQAGARLLDPTGVLKAGVPMCAPEGDAATGMVATNSVEKRTGNVSAGTSIFAMVVLENPLSKVYAEIDMVTTPTGVPVAMAHCNTCTSDMDAWIKLLGEMAAASGASLTTPELYDIFYNKAMEGEEDCGGLVNINYYSGEPITGFDNGRPLFVRKPDASLTLANFARAQVYSTMATLKIGMDILFEQEKVKLETLLGHGGLFKTPFIGQALMAGALNVPVAVMSTASEGGPWGIAVLAAYMMNKQASETLESYLANKVFKAVKGSTILPRAKNVQGFAQFLSNYKKALIAEKAAVEALK